MVKRAKIINVRIEHTPSGLLRATSPDMRGLHVSSTSIDALHERVKGMITDLFEADGQHVSVYEVEDTDQLSVSPWVVVPDNGARTAC